MGTRPRSKQRRRLEQWQVLLAAAIGAVGVIAAALIPLLAGGSPSGLSIAITGLLEQPYPPPPGRLYLWNGTVTGQPPGTSVYVIDKVAPGKFMVSPAAVVSGQNWTVTWTISKPPATARWIAVVFSNNMPVPCCHGLEDEGPDAPQVIATATYQPRARLSR